MILRSLMVLSNSGLKGSVMAGLNKAAAAKKNKKEERKKEKSCACTEGELFFSFPLFFFFFFFPFLSHTQKVQEKAFHSSILVLIVPNGHHVAREPAHRVVGELLAVAPVWIRVPQNPNQVASFE